jgi:hypothetical protein
MVRSAQAKLIKTGKYKAMPSKKGKKPAGRHYPQAPRSKIDRGETGDKVAFPDPALAPLGTDAEAGGHPPTSQETEIALKEETNPASIWPSGPELAPNRYFVEPNPKKAIAMFALASVLIFVAFVAIYAYWPRAIP